MSVFERFPIDSLFTRLEHRGRDLHPDAFPGKKKYIVSDCDISPAIESKVGRVIRSLDEIPASEIPQSVFYVCFACDSNALPVLRKIKEHGGQFVPNQHYEKTNYRFINRYAYDAMKWTWRQSERVGGWLEPSVHENVCEALELTKGVEGDYVEIGVYLGASALTAINYLRGLSQRHSRRRKAWLIDTFDGFNFEEAHGSFDVMWDNTHELARHGITMDFVRETLSAGNAGEADGDFELVQGNICADDLPAGVGTISVANIDVDLYESTVAALNKCAPRMAVGGIMICEDSTSTPGLYGAQLAMQEFIETDAGKCFLPVFKQGGYFLIKLAAAR